MSLAKLFAPTATSNAKTAPGEKSWPMFPLDAEIHTEPLRVCKSLIPYLPLEKQKSLSIFIKVYELMSVIDHYSDIGVEEAPINHYRESDTWQMDLLHSVKENLDPANAYWVDILFKINDVKDILASAGSEAPYQDSTRREPLAETAQASPTGTSQDFIENISPMLDDSQRQILETLSAFMK